MRSLNNSGMTQNMTNRMELNLSNNLDSAVVTKVDLIFKQ